MKTIRRISLALLAGVALAGSVAAQTYPVTTPTYTPSAILAPATFTTTGDYVFNVAGVSSVTLRVSGTCTSLVAAPQGSNDATNYSTLPAAPVGGGASVTSITGTGFWRLNTAGMNRVRLHITTLAASCTVAMTGTAAASQPDAGVTAASTVPAAATPALVVAQSPNGDPCQIPSVAKSSVAVNISSATTTNVVPLVAGQVTYVCGFNATVTGTTPTVLFKYGTNVGGACDTGATSLTGTYAPVTGTSVAIGGSGTQFQAAAAKDLCITSGGTGPSVQGVLTYVQR